MPVQSLAHLKIIWIALVNSVVVYLVVCWLVVTGTTELETAARSPIATTLYAMAVVLFVLAFVVSNRMTAADHSRLRTENEVLSKISQAFILRWALLESVAVVGLIAAMIGNSKELIVPPLILSLIGFILSFPSDRSVADLRGKMSSR